MAQEPSSSEGSDVGNTLRITFDDMLVTDEGEWIQSHRPQLAQIYRLVKRGCSRHGHTYLNGCSFNIFASFVYRWTDTAEEAEDIISIGSVSSHASVQMQG